ncbi:conjugative transposon protein TraM [Chryseobacterium sp. A301]
MLTNRIPYKKPRYVIPLIMLPFLLFLGYQFERFSAREQPARSEQAGLSLSFGESSDPILSKNEAYDAFFKNGDGFFALDSSEKKASLKEEESPFDPLKEEEVSSGLPKDSRDFIRLFNEKALGRAPNASPRERQSTNRMEAEKVEKASLAEEANSPRFGSAPFGTLEKNPTRSSISTDTRLSNAYGEDRTPVKNLAEYGVSENAEEKMDPIRILRSQMLVMDSLEKSRDPEFQAENRAQKKLLAHKEKLNEFLSSTLRVSKTTHSPHFNAVYKRSESFFIKAVIDEDLSGFLGSRIRLRLLEDIFVGNKKLFKGQILYAQVSGFSFERANLSIVSVLVKEEILPIHLTLYDLDGQKGLYVPGSEFRNMMKELGSSSVQGQSLDSAEPSFYSSLLSTAFRSASQSAAKLLRTNKAKLKYGTQVLLLEEAH